MEYSEQDYIQEAKEGDGFGHRRSYKYRVMSKDKMFITHHTNSLADAKNWFNKCREHWMQMDEISKEESK